MQGILSAVGNGFLTQSFNHLIGTEQALQHDLPDGGIGGGVCCAVCVNGCFGYHLQHQNSVFCLKKGQRFVVFLNANGQLLQMGLSAFGSFIPQPTKFPYSAGCPALR